MVKIGEVNKSVGHLLDSVLGLKYWCIVRWKNKLGFRDFFAVEPVDSGLGP